MGKILSLFFLFFINSFMLSFAITGDEVMKAVHDQNRLLKTQSMRVSMRIIDFKERERQRYFKLWKRLDYVKKDNQDMNTSMIKFYKPVKVKGTSLRTVVDNFDEKTNQWIYFPALKSLRKLNTKDKNKPFMGSDFNYSDIAGRRLNQDTHELVVEKDTYYVVRSMPKDPEDHYAKLMFKIDKKNFLIQQINFYNKAGRKFKVLKNQKFIKVKGAYVVSLSLMRNLDSKGYTILQVSDVKANVKIGDDILGLQGLKSL
eukprot:COSAG01_NODE_1222_length_11150_cov_2.405755_5_plen_258_part_00